MLGGTFEVHGYVAREKKGRSSEQIGMAYKHTTLHAGKCGWFWNL